MKNEFTAKNNQNTINLAIWTFGWLIATALATFGPKFLWESQILSAIGLIICTVVGIGMLYANMRFLNGLDELQRKIQLEAMAWALGIAVVGGLSYALADKIDLIQHDADIAFVVILIGITYMIGVLIGRNRYK